MVAVVGPNASGKSSLFKRMAGIIEGEGKVHLTGNKKGHFGVCYMPQEAVINARFMNPCFWYENNLPLHGVCITMS